MNLQLLVICDLLAGQTSCSAELSMKKVLLPRGQGHLTSWHKADGMANSVAHAQNVPLQFNSALQFAQACLN